MSEQQRTRLYAWLREQTDESLAEYLMACLAPAPLTDLVTKDHLSAELALLRAEFAAEFATKEDMNAGFAALRSEFAAEFATKEDMNAGFAALRSEFAAEFATKEDMNAGFASLRSEFAAQRAEDRDTARQRHYWLTGTVVSVGLAVGAPIWLSTLGIIG